MKVHLEMCPKDILGDLAMGVVGSFDVADAAILIPAILKNLRELKNING